MAHRGAFAPPELKINDVPHHEWRSTAYPEALTTANLCQVGLIMLACMGLEDDAPPVVWTSPTVNNNDLAATYSADLKRSGSKLPMGKSQHRDRPPALYFVRYNPKGCHISVTCEDLLSPGNRGTTSASCESRWLKITKIGFKFRRPAKRRGM